MTKEQMELLIQLITEIAKEIVLDQADDCNPDYRGMGLWAIQNRAEDLARKFNEAGQTQSTDSQP